MPVRVTEFDRDNIDFANAIMRKHHPDLHNAGVTVEYLFVHNAEDYPMRTRGQRVLGKVKIMSQEDRAMGSADARIKIDEGWWMESDDKAREALLDHEFTHLQLVDATQKDMDAGNVIGKWKTDNNGRPKLRLRHHDYEIGIFLSVIEKHKEHAADLMVVKQVNHAVRPLVQGVFWG